MFHAYLLHCADDTLYVGCTNDLEKRVHEHNHSKNGAKYTSGRRPVVLVYDERFRTLARARSREAALKRLARPAKLALIQGIDG